MQDASNYVSSVARRIKMSPPPVISGEVLVQLAAERLGAAGNTDLARKLGIVDTHADQTVRRWRTGENEPSYGPTMRILELLGALNLAALNVPTKKEQAEELRARLRQGDGKERRPGKPQSRSGSSGRNQGQA